MAWRRTGDKLLHEPMMTQFIGAYMCQLSSVKNVRCEVFSVVPWIIIICAACQMVPLHEWHSSNSQLCGHRMQRNFLAKPSLTYWGRDKIVAMVRIDYMFEWIFLDRNWFIQNSIDFSGSNFMQFDPKGQINNKPALVEIMVWGCRHFVVRMKTSDIACYSTGLCLLLAPLGYASPSWQQGADPGVAFCLRPMHPMIQISSK